MREVSISRYLRQNVEGLTQKPTPHTDHRTYIALQLSPPQISCFLYEISYITRWMVGLERSCTAYMFSILPHQQSVLYTRGKEMNA